MRQAPISAPESTATPDLDQNATGFTLHLAAGNRSAMTIKAYREAVDQLSRFEERRDKAIVLILLDTGIRLAEISGLRVDEVDIPRAPATSTLKVLGKGRRPRTVALGRDAASALQWYVKVRSNHPAHREPWLWLGLKGRLGSTGIAQMLKRRAREAGIPPGLHPHLFRHTFAHMYLAGGGQEGDLMQLAGWRSRTMLSRY